MNAPQGSPSTKKTTYLSGSLGGQGEEYQRQIAYILLQRLILNGGSKFELAFEMLEAGKFDDIGVFLNNSKYLIQSKHADIGGSIKTINEDALYDVCAGDFALVKYLINYHDMKFDRNKIDNIIIFTNRNLHPKFNTKSYQGTKLDKLLKFSKGRHLKLVNQETKMNEALNDNEFNSNINKISDQLIALFKNKQMNSILLNHHNYLKQLLVKDGSTVKFNKLGQCKHQIVKKLYKILDEKTGEDRIIDKTIEESAMGDFWTRTDKPIPTKYHAIVKEFFDKLVISVSQPNVAELKQEMINEARLWMRTWIRPDDLGRMGSNFHELPWTIIKKEFDEYETSGKNKEFLENDKGKSIVDEIKENLREEIQKTSKRSCVGLEAMEHYYIPRHMLGLENLPKILDSDFVKELYKTLNNHKCFALTAQPGMGKSTICQHLAFEAQKIHKDKTVFLLYLNNFRNALPNANKLEDILNLNIFENQLSKENIKFLVEESKTQIVIFFDGFDELSEGNQKSILKLVKVLLHKNNVKIIISGRRHVEEPLKNNLNAVCIKLEALSVEEQKQFLRKFWVNSNTNLNKFDNFSNKILGKLKSDISRKEYELSGIPLIMRMVAQIYAGPFEKYLNSNLDLDHFISDEKMSLIILIEQFFTESTEITMNKKYNVDNNREIDSFFKPFIKSIDYTYQVLAVDQLLSDLVQAFIANKQFYETLKSFQQNIENQQSLLIEIIAGKPRFTHLVFAEYFVAKYLYEYFGQKEALCCVLEILYYLYLLKNVCILLLSLIESKLFAKSNDIKECFQKLEQPDKNRLQLLKQLGKYAIVWACNGDFCYILKYLHYLQEPFFFETVEYDGKTLLQLAVENGSQKVEEFLVEIFKLNTTCKFPLHYAVKSDRFDLVTQLIDEKRDINLLDDEGKSPIFRAKSFVIFEYLVNNGAQMNIIDKLNNNLLHLACKYGYIETVKYLTDQKISVNLVNDNGDTPLNIALKNLHSDMAEYLFLNHNAEANCFNYAMSEYLLVYFCNNPLKFESGIQKNIQLGLLLRMDVNSKNSMGDTALHIVAKYNCKESIKMLCENNAVLNIRNKYGKTALHIAIERKSDEVVKFLISQQIDLHLVNTDGETILHFAVKHGNEEILKLIINKFVSSSTSLDAKDNYGKCAVSLAIDKGYDEKAKLLIKNGADLSNIQFSDFTECSAAMFHLVLEKGDKTKLDYNTLMNLAEKKGFDKSIKTFVNNGADVNVLDSAVNYGHINVVNELIKSGAKINYLYENGKSALHYCKSKQMYDFLVSEGADQNAKDNDGNICLHFAARNGCIKLVKHILAKDQTMVDYTNKKGQTALHMASSSMTDLVEIAEILISTGADINLKDNEGKTPIFYAVERGNTNMVQCLKNNSAKINSNDYKGMILTETKEYFGSKKIQSLLEANVDVNEVDEDGKTALHIAAENGEVDHLKILLNARANADILDRAGKYPLNYATKSQSISFKEKKGLLIDYTSNIDHRDELGETYLLSAIRWDKDEIFSRLLIAKKASIHVANKDGDTALHLAIKNKRKKTIEVLVELLDQFEINRQNNRGLTPLHLAVLENDVSIVQKLVEKGADIHLKTRKNETAIDLAQTENFVQILEYLENKAIQSESESQVRRREKSISANARSLLPVFNRFCNFFKLK